MKRNWKAAFPVILVSLLGMACKKQNLPDPLALQPPKPYSEEYYANLRAYKKTDHQICYGWYSDYSQSFTYAQRFMGLPDSIDIISLWGGIPSLRKDDPNAAYNPIAYEEMRYVREKKGTRMVVPIIVSVENAGFEKSDDGLKKYAKFLTDLVYDNDLDGLDLDWEPAGGSYLATQANFAKLVEYCSERVGPKSGTNKMLVVDYYTHTLPTTIEPYITYLVNQAYTQGTTSSSATFLQGRYNIVSSWCPVKKFIVTENIGDWWQNGGSPFTEANGNTLDADGNRLYSLEGMARWNPTQGKKGGWGAFYFIRDYNLNPPYKFMRRGIQAANPALQ